MVVDDEPDGRFFAERSLKKIFSDCSLVVCSSADEAAAKLEGTRPDAIVTDNQLGRQSGCDFIGHVRGKGITCPVVMVTCSDNPEVVSEAYRAGATKVFRAGGDEFATFLKAQLSAPPSAA